jgi:DMSO/TMAO reductase YedYZ heme-binding membrane subunit
MHESTKYCKPAILTASLLASVLIYIGLHASISSSTLLSIRLEEWYGFVSLGFLFFALLAGPLYRVFPGAPLRGAYYGSLGGLGISAFYFALLHSCIAFFALLDGFAGLPFLEGNDLVAALAGFVALLILAVLAGTSFTFAMRALGRWWKFLHRFVYLAVFLVLIHVVLIGVAYQNPDSLAYLLTLAGVLVLLVLHGVNATRTLTKRYPHVSPLWWSGCLILLMLLLLYGFTLLHLGHHHV